VQTQRLAEEPHVENQVRRNASEATNLRCLLRIERNGNIGWHIASDWCQFERVAVARQTPARAACAELRKKHLLVMVVIHGIPGRCAVSALMADDGRQSHHT